LRKNEGESEGSTVAADSASARSVNQKETEEERQSMNRIELREVSKRYGKKAVLDGLNLTVRRGEIYGLIGKNGAGKTTLFKTVLGLTEMQSGRVSIDGEATQAGLRKARRKIGFFIGGNFFDYLSAEENLRFYCGVKGIRDTAEIERVLALVGLSGVKSKFGAFSLGMRQRLGIANAMLGKPEILLLDEPVNGLDPEGIAKMRALFRKLAAEDGSTILLSSHILGELEHTADRFGILENGTLVREIARTELRSGADDCVTLRVSDLERARRVLQAAGIRILGREENGQSLEDYYFSLTGGRKDA
jgi:putative ABC transporter, ATP-binding protein